MKKYILIFAMILLQAGLFGFTALAHPGTGIIVDKYGNVYFIYTGVGVAKISPGGKLTYIYKATTMDIGCVLMNREFSHKHNQNILKGLLQMG